jgi:hypothetical protein
MDMAALMGKIIFMYTLSPRRASTVVLLAMAMDAPILQTAITGTVMEERFVYIVEALQQGKDVLMGQAVVMCDRVKAALKEML